MAKLSSANHPGVIALCEALHLDPHMVRSIRIEIDPGDVPRVHVEILADPEVTEHLPALLAGAHVEITEA